MVLFLLIFILCFFTGIFLPWWTLAMIVFLCCFWLAKSAKSAFILSFISIFFLWMMLCFYYSSENNHMLSNRMATLFGLGEAPYRWLWMVFIAPLPGAITAGFAGISGYFAKQIFLKK